MSAQSFPSRVLLQHTATSSLCVSRDYLNEFVHLSYLQFNFESDFELAIMLLIKARPWHFIETKSFKWAKLVRDLSNILCRSISPWRNVAHEDQMRCPHFLARSKSSCVVASVLQTRNLRRFSLRRFVCSLLSLPRSIQMEDYFDHNFELFSTNADLRSPSKRNSICTWFEKWGIFNILLFQLNFWLVISESW